MAITIDEDSGSLVVSGEGGNRTLPLYSDAAFAEISRLFVKVGWNQKYPYTFTWLGRPVIQLPEDMIRIQEVLYRVAPDVIVETGVAHGGSLIFYASLCAAMGRGRVIGVDIEIRPHNRQAIAAHPLAKYISLIEGSSTAPEVVDRVRWQIEPGEKVLVILDSNHSYAHVRDELAAYAPLVTPGSYIVATDGVMRDLADVPRGQPGWAADNPVRAVEEFARATLGFRLEQPPWPFNESTLTENVTYWPAAYLRRLDRSAP